MSSAPRYSNENEQTCVVCFKNFDIYSVGVCDHPVCFECSTRMRVLCRQNECPICRQDMPKVIFTRQKAPFKVLSSRIQSQYYDRKFGILFQSFNVQREYYQLLEHTCTICDRRGTFSNFNQLKDHMRKEHDLYYCDLCVQNVRIFTWERKAYNRTDLGIHRRKGDVDDTSHKGHPLCRFCDTRYMDSDELFRHLRRDHLFCHFCDADGLHQYYPSYECLRQHFLSEHFLCEDGECVYEKFTSVFRTDIDLKAHRASVHGKHLGKAGAKQARTLEFEFTLAPRPRPEQQATRGGRKPQPSSSNQGERLPEGAVGYDVFVEPDLPRQNVTLSAQDFPTLGGATAPAPPRPPGGLTIRTVARRKEALARTNENFPALSDAGTLRVSLNSGLSLQERSQSASSAPNVSIHVNHSANGAITTHISQNSNPIRVRPKTPPDQFPALGVAAVPDAQWVKPTAMKEVKPKVNKVAPAPVLPARDSPIDFPSLGGRDAKSKKSTTVTTPVTNTWVTHPENKDKNKAATPSMAEKLKVKEVESKDKNKKKKTKNTGSNNSSGNESTIKKTTSASKVEVVKKESAVRDDVKKVPKDGKQNGLVKKRSELKIESLQLTDPCTSNGHEDFPALGTRKPPPGFQTAPPPGFSANDLTFTNSSGQSYSILPSHQFKPPQDFAQRNRTLVDKFMEKLKVSEAIHEFKTISNQFRAGTYPAEQFYEHCEYVMGKDFRSMFPELLVLLPDIKKQQELYSLYCKDGANRSGLEICGTCQQILSSIDVNSHVSGHALDNHFPSLGTDTVWRK